jgi:hypothetical protein
MDEIKYIGSELWKNIEYTNDIDQLTNMSKYIDGAVLYHRTVNDENNLTFFLKAQDHWLTKVRVKVRIRKNEKD